ncbi:hypothetical protein [Brenneria uluponensis]|uniref:hypothetical protein n=1 Tax=Brenneria uluponensis TaxID=3057057 RepID=UPI0028EC0472|nr:hypothetical protein [Brenneria ulupoensis]
MKFNQQRSTGPNHSSRRKLRHAIVGTPDSGKSTLFNIFGLLDEPSSGMFSFHGINVIGQAIPLNIKINLMGYPSY